MHGCFAASILVLVLALPAAAQSGNQGSLEGTVSDPSGALVPRAAVQAKQVSTSATFHTTTNQAGLFRFPVLPVGTYELTVQVPGFATLIRKDVVVTISARLILPLALALSGQSETMVVSGRTAVVETTRAQVSATVDNRAISNLPVNGREFISFALLTPGVTTDVRGGLSFAGQRAMNSLLVDGVDQNTSFFQQPVGGEGFSGGGDSRYLVSQDAVQEFQVNSNSYSAEFGRASGGVINVVTKSGSNEFHGSGYWFYRDRFLNANSTVNKLNGLPRSPYHFNQFGGTFGGPLARNRLFFFFNYEGVRSQRANSVVLNLPAGFALSTNPVVAGFQQRALDYLAPRAASWTRPVKQDVSLAKLDWQLASAHLFTASWSRRRLTSTLAEAAQVSFENGSANFAEVDLLSGSLTSTLSGGVVHVARFAWLRNTAFFQPASDNPMADIFEGGQRVLLVGRAPNTPQSNLLHRLQWSDTAFYSRAGHSWKAGADFLFDRNRFANAQNFTGNYRFTSLESFGRSLAGAPAPMPGERYLQTFSGQGLPETMVHPNVFLLAGFVLDEWRVRPHLTLNLGLRYDLQFSAQPPVRNPSPALAAAGIDTSSLRTDTTNLAPRLGLAWAPWRDNRLVVRAGYGIFFSPTIALLIARAHFQNGITVQPQTFQAGTAGAILIPAYPNTICGPPDVPPSCSAPALGVANPILTPFAARHSEPYAQQGSFGLEMQLHQDFAVSVSYVSAKGTHLARTRDINLGTPTSPATIGIANTTSVLTFRRFTLPRPIAGFDRILQFESNANSTYHGFVVQATKRFSHNFQFLGSYTIGRAIDDNPNQYVANPGATEGFLISDPSAPQGDRGPGSNDQRHRFVLSGVWELNYANRLPGVARALLAGWQFSGILTAQSGQPYSGMVSFDLNNDRNALSDRTPGLGRNTFSAPATVSLDPRLARTIRLTEHASVQLIGEAFNVFNRGNVTVVRNTQFAHSISPAACGIAGASCLVPQDAGLTAFGTPTATSGPRILQLAVKILF
jgi:hypothetical protein